ncbi:MAG: RNA polymerase sigma factor [Bryobacteraceae bacterium]|nr:RNA polymerase sigma factor [Bryobacteraceae bacterium]
MTLELTDELLLRRMLEGDETAFTALYRRRQGGVYRFALQMSGSVEIAEEITQDTFMLLMRQGSRFDPAKGSVSGFLFGIARNLVRRHLEKVRNESWAELAADDPVADSRENVLDEMTRRETINAVRRAVLSLPPVYREALVLCELQGLSYLDAAAVLDCPVGTVRSRLNRGRTLLADKFRAPAMKAGAVAI